MTCWLCQWQQLLSQIQISLFNDNYDDTLGGRHHTLLWKNVKGHDKAAFFHLF